MNFKVQLYNTKRRRRVVVVLEANCIEEAKEKALLRLVKRENYVIRSVKEVNPA